jgi:hypothetical protein
MSQMGDLSCINGAPLTLLNFSDSIQLSEDITAINVLMTGLRSRPPRPPAILCGPEAIYDPTTETPQTPPSMYSYVHIHSSSATSRPHVHFLFRPDGQPAYVSARLLPCGTCSASCVSVRGRIIDQIRIRPRSRALRVHEALRNQMKCLSSPRHPVTGFACAARVRTACWLEPDLNIRRLR